MSTVVPIGLSPEHLADIFPFHFCINRRLVPVQVGSSLQRLVPALTTGAPFTLHASVEHPVPVKDFDDMLAWTDDLFIIHFHRLELRLRGQMMYLPEQESLLFLGSPWITEPATLQKLGLTAADFSLIDPAVDLLGVLEAQESAFHDVMLFARELTRQRTELQEANRQLTMQHTLAQILDESDTIEAAAPRLLRMVGEQLGWEHGVLWLPTRNGDALAAVATYDADPQNNKAFASIGMLPVGLGIVRRLQLDAVPLLLPIEDAIAVLPHGVVAADSGMTTACLVPVVSAGKTIGLFQFLFRTPVGAESLIRMMSELGGRTGDFIDKRRAMAALIKQDRLLRGIAEATGTILTSGDIENSAKEVLRTLGRTAGFDRIVLFENYRDDRNDACARRLFEWCDNTLAENSSTGAPSFHYESLLPGWYERFQRGEPMTISINNVSAADQQSLRRFSIHSMMAVPVFLDRTFWGVVRFDNMTDVAEWSDNEQSILLTLAMSLGGAIAHRRSEQALRESREQYQSVFNNVKEVVFQTNADGLWTLLNPAWQEMTGFSVEESLGTNFLDYVYPEDRQRNMELFLPLIQREKEYCRHVIRYCTRDGGFCWVEVFARLTLDENNTVVGTSGTLMDVTERKRAEEDVRSALKRERELNELKSRFITTISHEFRTPLTAILSSADILEYLDSTLSAEQRNGHLTAIQEAVARMTELLDDVLFIGRAETFRIPIRPVPVTLPLFLDHVLREVCAGDGEQHNVVVEQVGECRDVLFDEKLLWQICSNLLSNALKYSDAGTEIKLQVRCSADTLQLIVTDMGIGIPENEQPRLFDTFFRATNVGSVSGTGLGLAIVKHAVDLLGGRINVQSEYGRGSTFTVWLPVTPLAINMENV